MIAKNLQRAIDLRDMSAAQLSRDSGVDKSTISLILSGDRPNTPARIVAKLARALDVSVDYLVGIVDEPEPKAMDVSEASVQLARVSSQLSERQQRDLLLMAQSLLEAEADRDIAGIRAAMRVLERKQGTDTAEELARLLAEYLPELAAHIDAPATKQGGMESDQDQAARTG